MSTRGLADKCSNKHFQCFHDVEIQVSWISGIYTVNRMNLGLKRIVAVEAVFNRCVVPAPSAAKMPQTP